MACLSSSPVAVRLCSFAPAAVAGPWWRPWEATFWCGRPTPTWAPMATPCSQRRRTLAPTAWKTTPRWARVASTPFGLSLASAQVCAGCAASCGRRVTRVDVRHVSPRVARLALAASPSLCSWLPFCISSSHAAVVRLRSSRRQDTENCVDYYLQRLNVDTSWDAFHAIRDARAWGESSDNSQVPRFGINSDGRHVEFYRINTEGAFCRTEVRRSFEVPAPVSEILIALVAAAHAPSFLFLPSSPSFATTGIAWLLRESVCGEN